MIVQIEFQLSKTDSQIQTDLKSVKQIIILQQGFRLHFMNYLKQTSSSIPRSRTIFS